MALPHNSRTAERHPSATDQKRKDCKAVNEEVSYMHCKEYETGLKSENPMVGMQPDTSRLCGVIEMNAHRPLTRSNKEGISKIFVKGKNSCLHSPH